MFATLQGLTLGFAAGSSPGPFQAFLLSEAVQRGWRRSLPLALAAVMSDGPIITLTVLLLSTPDAFLSFIQLAGGLFILYLARGAFTSGRRHDLSQSKPTARPGLLKAAMNLLNPNPWLFWGTVGAPLIVAGWRENPLVGSSFLASFYLSISATNAALIILFATLGASGRSFRRGLIAVSSVALFGFGLFQLVSGAGGLS